MRRRWSPTLLLTVMIVCFLPCAAVFAQEQPPPPTYPMNASDSPEATAQIKSALDFIDGIMESKDKELTGDLRKALEEKRLKLDDLPDDRPGNTRDSLPQDALEILEFTATDPDKTIVTIDKDLITTGEKGLACFETEPKYIILMDVLYHEGVHMRQDRWLRDNETILEWKLRRVENEIGAYKRNLKFKSKVYKLLWDIGIADTPPQEQRPQIPFMRKWEDRNQLTPVAAEILRIQAGRLVDIKKARLATLAKLKEETNPVKVCQQLTMAHIEIPKDGPWYFVSSYSDKFREYPFRKVELPREVPSGVSWPLTMLGGRSREGRIWLLIAGYSNFELKLGIVRLFVDANGDEQLEEAEGRTLVENNPLLTVPSSLCRDQRGQVFIYDYAGRALFPVDDSDADGVPDAVQFQSIIRVPAEILEGYRFIYWVSGRLEAVVHAPGAGATGDPFVQFFDHDRDGIYEDAKKFRPGDAKDFSPFFCDKKPLFAGRREVMILGAKNHRVRVEETDESGRIVLRVLAEGKTSEKNTVVLTLTRPLRVWRYVRVVDLDNGQTSIPRQVTPPEPRAFSVRPWVLGNAGGERIVIKGAKLAGTAQVEFGYAAVWKEAPIVKRSEDALEVLAPSCPWGAAGGYVSVRLRTRMGGKDFIFAPSVRYYPKVRPK